MLYPFYENVGAWFYQTPTFIIEPIMYRGTKRRGGFCCLREGIEMRKNGRPRYRIGCLVALMGVFVLLALILPTSFWWFIFGALLIYLGLCVLR